MPAKVYATKRLPIVNEPGPEPADDEIDYDELAVQVWDHLPGAIDTQQAHDLVAEAKARNML